MNLASCSILVAAPGVDPRINENESSKFFHLPNEDFYDFNKILAEIVRDARRPRRDAAQAFRHNTLQVAYVLAQYPHPYTCRLARINPWRPTQRPRGPDS